MIQVRDKENRGRNFFSERQSELLVISGTHLSGFLGNTIKAFLGKACCNFVWLPNETSSFKVSDDLGDQWHSLPSRAVVAPSLDVILTLVKSTNFTFLPFTSNRLKL